MTELEDLLNEMPDGNDIDIDSLKEHLNRKEFGESLIQLIDSIEGLHDVSAGVGSITEQSTSERYPFMPKDNSRIKVNIDICLEDFANLDYLRENILALVKISNETEGRFDFGLLTLTGLLDQIRNKVEYIKSLRG